MEELAKNENSFNYRNYKRNWQVSVDFLVNNAGFNECGLFTNTDMEQEMKMIDLHIRFVTQITKPILPIMKKNNYGRIVNVGSTGSFIPSPSDAVYSATKVYIMSFSNALQIYGDEAGKCSRNSLP